MLNRSRSKSFKYYIIAGILLAVYFLTKKTGIAKNLLASVGGTALTKAAIFIKPWEGFRPVPYWDIKQWAWGYGTIAGTGADKPAGTITEAKAHEDLTRHLQDGESKIKSYLKSPVTENKMIALLSFDYNLGFGNTKNLLDRINQGKTNDEVAAAFRLYINAGGKPLQNLIDRRNAEAKKYLS